MRGAPSRDEDEVEPKEVEGREKNSSSGGSTPAHVSPSSGDSLPDARVNVDAPLSWLPEDYDVYRSEVQALLQKYSPDQADQLVRRAWGNSRFAFHAIADLCQKHEWSRFVAGVVITGNEANTPNARYLSTLLDKIDEPNDQQPSHERLSDDPKQRPSENHERIAAAIDAAF
jgi:hypothetical protein